MTLEELPSQLEQLLEELDKAGSVKAASKRARGILNDIKKSTTSIKDELMKLDRSHWFELSPGDAS